MPDMMRAETIVAWLEELFHRYGTPMSLMTDGGYNLTAGSSRSFVSSVQWSIALLPLYHNQGNGLAERAIRSVETMLRTTCEEQREWSQRLLACVMAYNKRRHLTTGVIHYLLVYNREARMTLDGEFDLMRRSFDAVTNRIAADANRRAEQRRIKKYYYQRRKRRAELKKDDLVAWHVQE